MRSILVLAGVLACLPLSAHAQSGGPDWDHRGGGMQMGGHDDGDWDSDHGDRGQGRWDGTTGAIATTPAGRGEPARRERRARWRPGR